MLCGMKLPRQPGCDRPPPTRPFPRFRVVQTNAVLASDLARGDFHTWKMLPEVHLRELPDLDLKSTLLSSPPLLKGIDSISAYY
jgi:hypothetical protein